MTGLKPHDVPNEVESSEWTLRVTGAVTQPCRFRLEELEALPGETITDDFECVEGWTAENLSWRGVRVETVLDRAEPTVDGGFVLVHAMDGDYACSFPRERVTDAVLAFGLDGETLPMEHGGPVRLVPTGADADCWESVKWVSELEIQDSEPVAGDTAEEIATGRLG